MGYMVSDRIEIDVCDNVLEFLGNSDVIISELTNSDRIFMLKLLEKYYLSLRSRIGIDNDISFGLEIEFEEANKDMISEELDMKFASGSWSMVRDDSLSNGAEINSPVLEDNSKTWIDLSCVCDIVNRYAYVMDNTSGHIHIGTQILGNNAKYWRNFALLWATYENVIFRFLYGEFVSPRSRIDEYAKPVSLDFIDNLDRIEDRVNNYVGAKYLFKVLDAGDEVLIHRYKENRRKHPLVSDGVALSEAVKNEREMLLKIRNNADYIVDTSYISIAQLRVMLSDTFCGSVSKVMKIQCKSFGFKYGVDTEADLVFDVRCLPNPFYIEDLKHKTGLEREVQDYVMNSIESKEFLERLISFLDSAVPLYTKEGKSQLTIAIGCTGGKHRSVTFAELICEHLKENKFNCVTVHRDIQKR